MEIEGKDVEKKYCEYLVIIWVFGKNKNYKEFVFFKRKKKLM